MSRRSSWLGGDAETYITTPKRDRPWLSNNAQAPAPMTPPPAPAVPYCIEYRPHRCPKCHTRKVKVYACRRPVRYLRCNNSDCEMRFKSVDVTED